MQQYLSPDEGFMWVRRMRFLYCPEERLIEFDITKLLDLFLPGKLKSIDQLIDSLIGGGIIPGAIRIHTEEIRVESQRLLDIIQALRTPEVA